MNSVLEFESSVLTHILAEHEPTDFIKVQLQSGHNIVGEILKT